MKMQPNKPVEATSVPRIADREAPRIFALARCLTGSVGKA